MKIFRRNNAEPTGPLTLSLARVGCAVRISELNGSACERLRRMGFCESMEVKKLSNGRNMLCSVCGTKMALEKKLADQILVSPI